MRQLQAIIAGVVARPGLRQGLALVTATTLAYGLDYLFNLIAGRLLEPADFGIVVSLAAAVQVMVVASRVIQTVTTRYVSRYEAAKGTPETVAVSAAAQTRAFFRATFRSAWWWGLAATIVLVVASPALARFFQIESAGPVLAIGVTAVFFALRPVVGGVLQGEQRFAALGMVQIVQAVLRLVVGVLLISLGWGAFGAMAALPVAVAGTLLFGLFLLDRQMLRAGKSAPDISLPDLFRYSAYTAAGLIGFAILVNMDAILVKGFFDPVEAGHYGTAVTLGKIVQFFPLAIIMILFPKAAQRQAGQRETGSILLAAMIIVGLACAVITAVYFLFSDIIIQTIFGPAYSLEGPVLGIMGLGMGLLSLVNVWLNYFLSTERTRFVYLIWLGVLIQLILMVLFHEDLWQFPLIIALNGFWITIGGVLMYLKR
jgi:O-antigen/teichoic acid export membrane protein